ncbi:MAG: NAD-dependent epimerase/dehydratase family protein [Proteobacteria bacterium]|nr:NAD-dependent epimerase/dehydratase family protein [Pseudomonadota bacterium]
MASAGERIVLLTGASGFLGPYIATAAIEAGWRVRAALRKPAANIGADAVFVGAIGSRTDWTAALAGVDAVVHLAARVHRPRAVQRVERDAYVEVNTEGALCLARAAAVAGVRHFVFMSSIFVNGLATDGRAAFNEMDLPAPGSVYGETKAAAEVGLRAIVTQSAMACTVIRPPMIYGRHAKGSFRALVRAISAGLPLPFAAVRNRRAFVAAENVASFVAWRLAGGAHGFETFIVADDEQLSTAELSRHVARTLGRRAMLFPFPTTMLRAALRIAGLSDLADSTLGSLEVDTGKARAAGWRPAVTMEEGLARALRPER